MPPAVQNPLKPSIGPAAARRALDALASIAKPFQAPILREGMEPEAYVDAFLQAFGASGAAARIWREPSGHAIVISDQLFRDGRGNLKDHVQRSKRACGAPRRGGDGPG